MAGNEGLKEPQVKPDGSIAFVPLPDHPDPDFDDLTYGDPWGRLNSFDEGDVAWFIESGTVNSSDWGYYIVAYFVIEDVYAKRNGVWNKQLRKSHAARIANNAHEIRRDNKYTVILGYSNSSKMLFEKPYRISWGQDPYDRVKLILGLSLDKPATGYWYKKWFDGKPTTSLLREIVGCASTRC